MSVKNFNFDNSYNPAPVKIENFTPAPAPGLVFVQKSDSCSGKILDSRRSPLRHSGSVITSAQCKLGLLILGYSIERLDRQKRKFANWSKKGSFLCMHTKWVCLLGTQRFCKNDSDSCFAVFQQLRLCDDVFSTHVDEFGDFGAVFGTALKERNQTIGYKKMMVYPPIAKHFWYFDDEFLQKKRRKYDLDCFYYLSFLDIEFYN